MFSLVGACLAGIPLEAEVCHAQTYIPDMYRESSERREDSCQITVWDSAADQDASGCPETQEDTLEPASVSRNRVLCWVNDDAWICIGPVEGP